MKLKRHELNPIIKPRGGGWESVAVCNCAAVYKDGLVHLLYRAAGERDPYISRLGYGVSRDGVNFERKAEPVFGPGEDYDRWGCEDPRITAIGGEFYITYVALCKPARKGGGPPRTALISTVDFINFRRHGIITPEGSDARDTVLFPEKINGKYVMLHRPHNWTQKFIHEKGGKLYLEVKENTIEWPLEEKPDFFPEKAGIWIAYSSDLKNWSGHKLIMQGKEIWESGKIGAGPQPIKTDKGWLLIYHGVGPDKGVSKYKTGAVLLDLNDPSRIIARTKDPILEPEKDYEIAGDVANVVFPEGIIEKDGELYIYYGAADNTCCLASCRLNELLEACQGK
ncbi:MAG: glycosidase [Elusimicrobia bacterium]|nr:glycosidase [Elusimicrobiota bacterium]